MINLDAAIKQAAEFAGYEYDEPGGEKFNEERQAYWRHLYEKLQAIKENSKHD